MASVTNRSSGGGGFASTAAGLIPFGNGAGALTDDNQIKYGETADLAFLNLTAPDGRLLALRAYQAGASGTTGGVSNVALAVFYGGSENVMISSSASAAYIASNDVARIKCETNGNVVIAPLAALATNATDGFFLLPTCAGTPTGAATNGSMVRDSTTDKVFLRTGGAWKSVTFA